MVSWISFTWMLVIPGKYLFLGLPMCGEGTNLETTLAVPAGRAVGLSKTDFLNLGSWERAVDSVLFYFRVCVATAKTTCLPPLLMVATFTLLMIWLEDTMHLARCGIGKGFRVAQSVQRKVFEKRCIFAPSGKFFEMQGNETIGEKTQREIHIY